MANSAQARKRARQSQTRNAHNAVQRSTMRTSVKQFLKAVEVKDVDSASNAYKSAVSLIDKATLKGHHHKNRAARMKSRLNARLHAIS